MFSPIIMPRQAGLGQSSDVTPLPLGVARYAQPGGHQQVTLAEPFGGVVEFADMRPANRAVEAAGSAQQARTEFGRAIRWRMLCGMSRKLQAWAFSVIAPGAGSAPCHQLAGSIPSAEAIA